MDFSRRQLLQAAGASGLCGMTSTANAQLPAAKAQANFKIAKGRIRQSVMGWCFKPMSADELAKQGRDIGLVGIEGIAWTDYPAVRRRGLEISLVSSHGFSKGPCTRDNHESCATKLRASIDQAVKVGCPSVITFTGMREPGITDKRGAQNCVDLWKSVIGYAEERKVTLCLEHLNSRDDTHPMKGHPGYFGDDVDFCVDLIRRVGSPNMKLLFDIYHVQVMNGDVIRRIRQYQDLIGHYHTAGNPGRGELDDTQEINYPAVMKAIVATGYEGYVAQEFIPTWDDKAKALRHAAEVCDV